VFNDPLKVLFGHSYVPADAVPGVVSLVLALGAVAVIVAGVLRVFASGTAPAEWPWRSLRKIHVERVGWLPVFMTLGVLAITLTYSALDTTIYTPRNVIAVLPYSCLLVGMAVTALNRRVALAAVGTLVFAAFLGSVRMLADYPRPDLHAAANSIAERAAPGTPVIEPPRFGHNPSNPRYDPLQAGLAIYLDDGFPLSHQLNARQWPTQGDVYTVASGSLQQAQVAQLARTAGAGLVDTTTFDGFQLVTLTHYSMGVTTGAAAGTSALHDYLQEHPGALRDYLEQHPEALDKFQRKLQQQPTP
jgi:hypothetical protein